MTKSWPEGPKDNSQGQAERCPWTKNGSRSSTLKGSQTVLNLRPSQQGRGSLTVMTRDGASLAPG